MPRMMKTVRCPMPTAEQIDFDVFVPNPGKLVDVFFAAERGSGIAIPGQPTPMVVIPVLLFDIDPGTPTWVRSFTWAPQDTVLDANRPLNPLGAWQLGDMILGLYEKELNWEERIPGEDVLARAEYVRELNANPTTYQTVTPVWSRLETTVQELYRQRVRTQAPQTRKAAWEAWHRDAGNGIEYEQSKEFRS